MSTRFAFDHPDDALRALAARLKVVGVEENIDMMAAVDRVLAEPLVADRDSPASDVSAMDGYAVRLSQLQSHSPVPISGTAIPGKPSPAMIDGAIVRMFTGAIVPEAAEAVIKREETIETDVEVRFTETALSVADGENIRRAGENASRSSTVIAAGSVMNPAKMATAINFGRFAVDLFTNVNVSVITTGDEVGLFVDEPPQPWQLQNSNRFAIGGLLKQKSWITTVGFDHCRDDKKLLTDLIARQLERSDAVLVTGGVSMGDYDYVPDVVRDVGGEVVFHGLPLRPGKPILGAVTGEGKLIVGLPGNPVSATIGCRRMAMPLLAKMSGQVNWLPSTSAVRLEDADAKTLPLYWMRLVRLGQPGTARLVVSQGSGDVVSLSQSDGFVETPPSRAGEGPWPFFPW